MSGMHFTAANFRNTAATAWPLLEASALKVGWDTFPVPFQPDWERYFAMEAAGRMLWSLAHKAEELVGCSMWFIHPSLTHKGLLIGGLHSFYVAEPHNTAWNVLRYLRWLEGQLKARGTGLLMFDSWVQDGVAQRKDLGPLLRRAGWTHRGASYHKEG